MRKTTTKNSRIEWRMRCIAENGSIVNESELRDKDAPPNEGEAAASADSWNDESDFDSTRRNTAQRQIDDLVESLRSDPRRALVANKRRFADGYDALCPSESLIELDLPRRRRSRSAALKLEPTRFLLIARGRLYEIANLFPFTGIFCFLCRRLWLRI